MKKLKLKIIVISVLLIPIMSNAQIKIELDVSTGLSNNFTINSSSPYQETIYWHEKDIKEGEIGNFKEDNFSFSLGANIYYTLFNSKFHITSGLAYNYLSHTQGFLNNGNEDTEIWDKYYRETWLQSINSISIPIGLAYTILNNTYLKTGLNNSYIFNVKGYYPNELESYNNKNKYIKSLYLGVDFRIKNKYVIGILYQRDLDSYLEYIDSQNHIGERYHKLVLKIGFIFN